MRLIKPFVVALVALLWANSAMAGCGGAGGIPFNCSPLSALSLNDYLLVGDTTVTPNNTGKATLQQVLQLMVSSIPGLVTSVGLADASTTPIFGITNTPVTTVGTLTMTLVTQSANTVFAGPASGSAAQPGFRALVGADLPQFSSTLAGAVPLSGGGTTNFLRADGSWAAPPGGGSAITALTGDVTATGPGSATATVVNLSGVTNASLPNTGLVNSSISGIALGSNLDALTFGTHLAAGGTSYNGSAGVTITSDATDANTASTIVARDASGNFSAGTVTASLTGHASLDCALSGCSVAGLTATGSFTATGLVTNADLANPATTVMGQGCTLGATCVTATQATAFLNLFSATLQGAAPSSGGGTTNFLRADGSWAVPPGTGGGAVSSVSNSDSTLTVAPTTGAVVASLNLANANTWTARQIISDTTTDGAGAGAGQIFLGGEATVPSGGNGAGQIVADAAHGLEFIGIGSTYDVSLYSKIGVPALGVPTGTQNLVAFGSLTGVVGFSASGTITINGPATYTNSDILLKGSSTGATTFTSDNAGASNFTAHFPANTGVLSETNLAESITAAKTFGVGDLLFLNSSGGTTTLAGAASASNFTATFQAANITVAGINLAQTWTAIQTHSAGLVENGGITGTGNINTSGTVTFSGLGTGTQVSCLGLTSGNVVVPATGACGTGGGSLTVTDGTHSVSSTTTLTVGGGFVVGGSAGSATLNLLNVDTTHTVSATVANIGGQDNYNGSSLTATLIGSGGVSAGQTLLVTNFNATTLTISNNSQTVTGLPLSTSLHTGGFYAYTATSGTAYDAYGFPGFGTITTNALAKFIDGTGAWTASAIVDNGSSILISEGAAVAPSVLTDATTIAVNANLSNNFSVTLGGNRTLGNPTNLQAGQYLTFTVIQPSSGGPDTLAFGTDYSWLSGAAPLLNTGASAKTLIGCYADTTATLQCSGGAPSIIALTSLATQAANTILGNATSGSASPTALAAPSCSAATSALTWTSGTGFGCNTTIGVSVSSNPGNLAGPSSTTLFTMQGDAISVTPAHSGSGIIYIYGTIQTTATVVTDGVSYQASYGTGTAPTTNAALTGTQCGTAQSDQPGTAITTAADYQKGFFIACAVSGLTVGTTYWIDLAAKAIGATGYKLVNVSGGLVEN